MKTKLIAGALLLGVLYGFAGQTIAGGKTGGSMYCLKHPTAPACAPVVGA